MIVINPLYLMIAGGVVIIEISLDLIISGRKRLETDILIMPLRVIGLLIMGYTSMIATLLIRGVECGFFAILAWVIFGVIFFAVTSSNSTALRTGVVYGTAVDIAFTPVIGIASLVCSFCIFSIALVISLIVKNKESRLKRIFRIREKFFYQVWLRIRYFRLPELLSIITPVSIYMLIMGY